MRLPHTLAAGLAIAIAPAVAQREVLVIGDSLSREYQFEFPNFEDARNWVEILAVHRPAHVSFGDLEQLDLSLFDVACGIFGGGAFCEAIDGTDSLDRYRYNWAIPTFTAEAYRDNLTGTGLSDELWQALIEPDFDEVDTVVVFLGGNDIDGVYGSIYGGNSSAADRLVRDLTDDLETIVNYVMSRNPSLEIVLVNVPHVGATPEVKGDHPTDALRTGRVTDTVNRINELLLEFAVEEGIAYADIASLTIELLEPDTYCIGGMEFFNSGTDSGAPEFLWLGGDVSQNFHPNTNGQAIVANAIVDALNESYSAGIPRLRNREILESVLGFDADMVLSDWTAGFGLGPGQDGPGDDPEGDGLCNLIEFALDLNPSQSDAHRLPSPEVVGDEIQLRFTPRDSDCEYVRVVGESSTDLQTWQEASGRVEDGDGQVTVSTGEDFLRLRVEVID